MEILQNPVSLDESVDALKFIPKHLPSKLGKVYLRPLP